MTPICHAYQSLSAIGNAPCRCGGGRPPLTAARL
jgi:hypothetical protein